MQQRNWLPRLIGAANIRSGFAMLAIVALFFLLRYISVWERTAFSGEQEPIDSYRSALVRLGFLRPLLPQVRVQQKENGREHSFKGSAVGTGCVRPKMDINDTEIMQLMAPAKPIYCKNESNWITTKNGRVMLKRTATVGNSSIRCRIEPFEFIDDFTTRTLNSSEVSHDTSVPTDFFKAHCIAADGSNYTNYHATIVTKGKLGRKVGRVVGFDRPLNIYMFAFDTLSRLMYMRKLRKTYKYVTEVLNATVLEMYNIVGDGTLAALTPILTGKTELELPAARRSERNASFVDVYPFIWKELERLGYVTLFAEDAPDVGTYTYRLKGFKQQPTDHYLRTFYRKIETDTNVTNQLCFGSESELRVQLSYVEDFFIAYPRDQPKFAFQLSVLYSHNDNNLVEIADDPTLKHLQFFVENGFLNDTVFIVFSDHGARFSSLRRTKQGKLEERNPFVSIILPPWFEQRYPSAVSNLRKNGDRLTTPFDLHATLKSLLNFPPPLVGNLGNRGISLFSEIPASRDCANADIAPHWCSCFSWKPLPKDSRMCRFIAEELVKAFNERLKKQEKLCSRLSLQSVLEAYVSLPTDEYVRHVGTKDDRYPKALFGKRVDAPYYSYKLTFRTNPLNALYEATVLYDVTNRVLLIDLDSVSRLNAYGSASHCIIAKDSYLAIWCVCKDQLG